ncbi:VOC family protein [Pontibacillus salicampi]|uniref:VOC family protein n=1 Tax=Pontibacillus salicampi TaxID=1449801 RepID=A0ABV6LR77_9BACI
MNSFLKRIGTAYLPVSNVGASSKWYQEHLDAIENFRSDDKAILAFANQSFFLIKSQEGQNLQFLDNSGKQHCPFTFEVDGMDQLRKFHHYLINAGISVGKIEDRGHPGYNFVFYDPDGNAFDVWSELSPDFNMRYD